MAHTESFYWIIHSGYTKISGGTSLSSCPVRFHGLIHSNLHQYPIFSTNFQILKRLPAAPGMITYLQNAPNDGNDTKKERVMVHCYYQHLDSFLVSTGPVDDEETIHSESTAAPQHTKPLQYFQVSPKMLSMSAPSAKFYPILESLMIRADQTAATAQELLQSEASKRIVESTGKAIQIGAETIAALEIDKKITATTSSMDGIELATKNAIPKIEEQAKQVITMIKDKEITVLLQECKNRLEQLSTTNFSEVTQRTLEKSGIYVQIRDEVTDNNSNLMQSVQVTRESALSTLKDLMVFAEIDDLTNAHTEIAKKFALTFDSLSKAAKSDRSLDALFASVAEKTTVWQEATGRLMSTRSAGLFVEGASRIQARAAAIFGNGQLQVLGEIGSELTKSFTEGDAALARLKSIELGDAVKNRLVKAIEVRSESLGGLDGIIVGALSTIKIKGDATDNRIPDMLQNLQQNASLVTSNAHETLISVLSSRSLYRDRVLLRLEKTLCDLNDHIGDDMSPDAIAAIVRGEGGTAQIFEPIARRAMKQIEKQLDTAEAQVTDETTLKVLNRIRKITSGELTLAAILDDLVNVLNDDAVVSAGESLVRHSEQVFDAIEGVSANKAVSDAIQIAERAGITKETVMREFEKLKVDDILGVAEKAVTDAKARRRMLSTATDVALDFVLRILPSMPVPPFEGVKDGLVYHISNLSMKGFKVQKEDIQIELAGMRATRHHNAKKSSDRDTGSQLHPSITKTYSVDSDCSDMDIDDVLRPIKATELLIIDIRNTSAVLENALWSFEQTYLPYLKGGGVANVRMSGGSIRLQFELRKRRKDKATVGEDGMTGWEPVLCLHDRSCTIAEVDLTLEGESTVTWLMNKVAAIFKSPLRDYVVVTIVKVLTNRSGWILNKLNTILSPYWDLILRTANLDLVSIGAFYPCHSRATFVLYEGLTK